MKQRFSAAGSIPLWTASSIEGLENAGFTDLFLKDMGAMTASRNGEPFSVSVEDRSPGQITLELIGPKEEDFTLYKYHVAKVLKRRLEEKDAENQAKAFVDARLSSQEKTPEPADDRVPDFSELYEGVTAPLPIVEILKTEEAITRDALARKHLSEQAANEVNEAVDENALPSPITKEEILSMEESEPLPEDSLVIIDEERQALKDDGIDKNEEEVHSFLESDSRADSLKPIANPTTPGELYNNLLLENEKPEEAKPEAVLPKKPWFQQDWFLLLLFVLIPPVGIFMIWRDKLYTEKVRKFLSIFLAVYTVAWLFFVVHIILPTPSGTDQGSLQVKASEVIVPSKKEQVEAYWQQQAVQTYMREMPPLIAQYQSLRSQGLAAAGAQILQTLSRISTLDDEVLKLSSLSSDNGGASLQASVNQTAVAFNEGLLNLRRGLEGSNTNLQQQALNQLSEAISLFQGLNEKYQQALLQS